MGQFDALATKVTVVHNPTSNSQAHVAGCKAATSRIKGQDSEVHANAFTVASLLEMQANPDEGTFKIHACLKPVLAAAKAYKNQG